eukprot:TRINITY_DN6362_c0_g1_i2.p1 TRINITY_DN6362_c0_g1~~TRINITY_DN6362_c0_g1_i2.p1  ORF type:complete len:294 (+),score=78.90 TRINITY_DN6362_c0_g1_i2:1040-1921(+)
MKTKEDEEPHSTRKRHNLLPESDERAALLTKGTASAPKIAAPPWSKEAKKKRCCSCRRLRSSVFGRVSFCLFVLFGVAGLVLVLLGSTPTVTWPLCSPNKDRGSSVTAQLNMTVKVPVGIAGVLREGKRDTYMWHLPTTLDTAALQLAFCVLGDVHVYVREGDLPSKKSTDRATSYGTWEFECPDESYLKLSHFQCDVFDVTKRWYFYIAVDNAAGVQTAYNITVMPITGVDTCDQANIMGERLALFLWIMGFCSAGMYFMAVAITSLLYWLCTNGTHQAERFHARTTMQSAF